jgi:peptidoglycan hydrolase-like protein with peptidoglycan-binding domain
MVVAACQGDEAAVPATGETLPTSSSATTTPSTAPPGTTVPAAPSPPTQGTSSTTSTTSTTPTTEPAAAAPDLSLLVPAPEGLALWRDGELAWLLTERPVGLAVPDLTGGVLFQHVDPARPEWSWDDASGRWRMSWPAGGPEPILRQVVPGGPISTAVPTEGARLWLLDSALVDGVPTVAYGRLVGGDERVVPGFPHCDDDDLCGEIGWRVQLVVRAVEGGAERIVREALWQHGITESTTHTARLGADLVALVATPYAGGGEYSSRSVTFLDARGRVAEHVRLDPSCEWCDLAADLAPDGNAFVSLERSFEEWSETAIGPAEVAMADASSGEERWRVALPGDGHGIDTDGRRAVVTVDGSCDGAEPPVLASGDRGPWVERLQRQLNRMIAADLDMDATFGPATGAAVREWQTLTGRVPTGVMEPATWGGLLPDRSCTTELLVVDGEGVTPIELSIGWGRDDPAARMGAPNRGVALIDGDLEPPVAEPSSVAEIVLRPDGIGLYDFGAERAEVEAWLTSILGPLDAGTDEPAPVYTCARWGCAESLLLRWPNAGLHVAFADRAHTGEQLPEPVLVAWTVSVDRWWPGRIFPPGLTWVDHPVRERLVTAEGIGLGSTVEELGRLVPSTEVLGWNDSSFQPTGFYIPDEGAGVAIEGDLDWQLVEDLQAALNDAGATLVVDGIPGPATRAALAEFADQHALESSARIVDALGLRPDPDARVIRLSAGGWFWEFGCGEMNVFGFDDRC